MIYLWVRRTTDWDDEALFRRQLAPAFAPRVALWDATFTIPYREFRSELKRIAAANLSRVRDAVVAAWDEIPEGAWVVPVDDDDWFAPDLARHLGPVAGGEGCRWSASFLEVPIDWGHRLALWRRRLFPGARLKWTCATNNYALPKTAANEPLLTSHVAASRWCDAQAGGMAVLPQRLSLMNRSLASQTTLHFRRPRLSRATLLARWQAYRTLYAPPREPELAWSAPEVARMAALMASLGLR